MKKEYIYLSIFSALAIFLVYRNRANAAPIVEPADVIFDVQGTGINYTIKEEILNPIKLEV